MVSWDVTIEGTAVQDIFEVNYTSGKTDRIGRCEVLCANSSSNRAFQSGDKAVVKKNGTIDFKGYVIGKPTKEGPENVTLSIELGDKRTELKYELVKRVFYQMDTGSIIKQAVNKRTVPKSRVNVTTADSLSSWSFDTPESELGNISSQTLHEKGDDFIFLGWYEDSPAEQEIYHATFSSVPSSAIPGDGQVESLKTRFLVNNKGDEFDVEINLRDNAGNQYNWTPDIGSNFTTYDLPAEEAVPEASIGSTVSTNGTLEFRFKISNQLPETRAAAIDYVTTAPFKLQSRNTPISTSEVKATGNVITRRFDTDIFTLIKELSVEDGYISYIDKNDVLHYEQSGNTVSSKSITEGTTPVVEAEFNRDYEDIQNKVTVQGAGNIRVTLKDSASVKFYGVSPREKPITDKNIQTRKEAVRRARGFLRKHAWADTAFSFRIMDTSYQNVRIGQEMDVSWPSEDIDGKYTVSSSETDYHGIVTLGFTSSDVV